MAQVREIRLIDDIDGSEGSHALEFAINGKTYEIDLSEANQAEFDSVTEKFVKAARLATPGRGKGRGKQAASPQRMARSDSTAIRAWAKENGHQVSDRGRVSREVQQAYQEARERGEV